MNTISLALAIIYLLLVLGLCTWLLMRGRAHSFVGLFALGALLELVPRVGFLTLQTVPGGLGANTQFFPLLSLFGIAGTLCFAGGFITLTNFLLRNAQQ